MAFLARTHGVDLVDFEMRGDSRDWVKRSIAALERLEQVSLSLVPGEVVGALLKFQVADNYAYYRVVGAKPLVIEHIPFMDGYSISAEEIRKLTLADVKLHWLREKSWACYRRKAS